MALLAALVLPIVNDARADDAGIPANHRELSAITELWEPVPRKVAPGGLDEALAAGGAEALPGLGLPHDGAVRSVTVAPRDL